MPYRHIALPPLPALAASARDSRKSTASPRKAMPSFLLPFAIGAVAGTVYTLARITVDDRVAAAIIAALVLVSLAPLLSAPRRC